MGLPEHLHPKTYWERRAELTEESLRRLITIMANLEFSPAMCQAAAEHSREWNRLIGELGNQSPAPATPTH